MDARTTTGLLRQGRKLLEQCADEEALACLSRAYARAPRHARIRSYYGLAIARAEGRFAEARALCNSSLEQEFFNPDLYENAARVHLVSGDKADAIHFLQRGRMIDPSHAGISGLIRELGIRRKPVLRFLPRGHRVNVWLGRLRQTLVAPRSGKSP